MIFEISARVMTASGWNILLPVVESMLP